MKLEEIQQYFDEPTGEKLSLWFKKHEFIVDKIVVSVKGVPLLLNERTEEIHFPNKTKQMIAYYVNEAKKNNKQRVRISPKNLENKRYSFAKNFDFQYSQVDYEYIPGLTKPWDEDEGFLTPVFFNISVLNKFSQDPSYKLDLFSETYGKISKESEWNILFGVNKNKKVILWLGDIDSLPDSEKHYLLSENISSDHDIQSEFYDAQIDAQFSEPSKQSTIFHLREKLNDFVINNLSFGIYMLEEEVSEVISNLHRPMFWKDQHVGPVIEYFNRVFVESINNKAIKADIRSINAATDVKNKGSLKILQLWLEVRLNCNNASELMCPFYVLYDFRIITCHLQSSNKKADTLKSINLRLNIDENNEDYELIYDRIINKLSASFVEILEQTKMLTMK
ncbi:MAG: hypothetical protein FE834_05630 [Gammaproteobacteria bacterium]|nr:hypothetical protein [Gammaproteobacteria bacterium]